MTSYKKFFVFFLPSSLFSPTQTFHHASASLIDRIMTGSPGFICLPITCQHPSPERLSLWVLGQTSSTHCSGVPNSNASQHVGAVASSKPCRRGRKDLYHCCPITDLEFRLTDISCLISAENQTSQHENDEEISDSSFTDLSSRNSSSGSIDHGDENTSDDENQEKTQDGSYRARLKAEAEIRKLLNSSPEIIKQLGDAIWIIEQNKANRKVAQDGAEYLDFLTVEDVETRTSQCESHLFPHRLSLVGEKTMIMSLIFH